MTTAQRMTFDDLMAQPDDGHLYELVRGEIIRMPPPKTNHGYVEAALVEAIGRYLQARALDLGWDESQGLAARSRLVGRQLSGEAGVRFRLPDDPDQTRGLDAGYLSPEQVARLQGVPASEYIREAPVLCVEVISPSETAAYVDQKVADYLAAGARQVWLLYPPRRVVRVFYPDETSRTVAANGTLDSGDVLPGFTIALSGIFE